MDAYKKEDISTMDDEMLLNLGLMVLWEILNRRIHMNTGGIQPKKKAVGAKATKKVTHAQPPLVISDDELGVDLLCAEELTADSFASPAPSTQESAPGAPKKKKAPAKSKQAAANAMFNVDLEAGRVVEECD